MENSVDDKIFQQLNYIVFWINPAGKVIPKNLTARQFISDLPAGDNLMQELFQFDSYEELLQGAENSHRKMSEITIRQGMKRRVLWEFIPGKNGVICMTLDWRLIGQLLHNIKEGNVLFHEILLNIFPDYIVNELVARKSVHPKVYRHSTILFTDVVGFSRLAFHLDPVTLIRKLDSYFSLYDSIMDEYGIEKIKTIGDSYMCASGLPVKRESHAVDCCLAALHLLKRMEIQKEPEHIIKDIDINNWRIRIGIHSGPCISGVVGFKKYTFDIWGDSVNIASRMQKASDPDRINISDKTFERVKDLFDCSYRGKQEIKNIGRVNMYFLNRIKKRFSEDPMGNYPNDKFKKIYMEQYYTSEEGRRDLASVPSFMKEYITVHHEGGC